MAMETPGSPGPPSPSGEVRSIREVIRSTEHQLEELKFQFPDFGNRPSLVVEEEIELCKRLEDLQRRERFLIERGSPQERVIDYDSSDREMTSSNSPDIFNSPSPRLSPTSRGGNHHSVHLTVTPSSPIHARSLSHVPSPNSPNQHHPPLQASISAAVPGLGPGTSLIRVSLPEGQRTIVHAKPGVTVKQALKKAMRALNLTTVESVVSLAQKDRPRQIVDWNTDTVLLSGEEVYVEYKENFQQNTPNHHNFVRKTFITLAFCDVCKKLLFQGFRCEMCGFRFHQRCSAKVPIRCSYYDDDILYAYLLSGQPTPAVLQQSHPQTPQFPLPPSPFLPTPPHSNSRIIADQVCSDSPEVQQVRKSSLGMRDRSISTPNVHYNSTAPDREGISSDDEESTVYFEEALENGYVECTMTTCAVTGAAGSGKSHTMYLALNESPPDVRQSTGLLEPVRALSTVVGASQSGSFEWSRVDEDEVLGIVAGATSVTNAEEQPSVQTSPSPLTYSASKESFSTSVPPATPQDVHTQKQPERFSEADISEQVSRSELASYTEVIDEQLTKLAGLLKKPVGRRRVTKLDFLYFLDSGGQPQFHELLSTFIPNLSTILFVLKLSEKLSHHPVIEYYKEGKSVCSYRSPHSHEQILKHCIRALQPEKRSVESSSSSTPNIAVVGTHKDLESQCEGETRDEKNQKLLDLLQPRFGNSLIFYHHLKELIYPVNAKNPDKGDKAVAGKLVEATLRSSAAKPVRIPLPWFMLEQVLRKLAKERGTGVMHIDECREIAARLHIKTSAFYAALKYLVSLNLFLYYPTVLPGVVFCVPQIFLDKINELVQHRHILCGRSSTLPGSAESTSPTGLSGKHWLQFQNHGAFHEKFLQEKAFSTHYDEDLFTPTDFLKLLESLLIVGRVNTRDINIEYVMPSLLFELKSETLGEHRCDPVTSPAAPLLVYFPGEWPTSGVFCSFLASLLSTQNWEVMVDPMKKPICLYRNCFKFRHPVMAGSITLIDSFDRGYFEVHVKAPPEECIKHCPEIRKSVFAALPPKAPVQAEVAFFCPNSMKKDASCRSTLHLADTKSRHYWSCSENPEEVGSLAETLNMTVWGVTRTSASEEREHGCQNPTVGAQLSGSVDEKLSNRPVVYQLKKLKGKEGRTVKVIEGVAAEWEQLAYILQFSPAVVRTVQRDTTDCTAACVEVLYRWINGAEGTRQPVNWATLIECLRDCDFVVLAKDLENVLCEH